jgi:hypothetical protein
MVLSDCAKFYDQYPVPILGCHTVAARFLQDYRNIDFEQDTATNYCANIFVNKKQMSRFLSLKLASFHKISFDYVWNGIGRDGNFDRIFKENDLFQYVPNTHNLLSRLRLKKQWIDDSYGDQDPDSVDPSLIELPHGGDNVYCWHTFMKQLITPSAVSLINENPNYENASLTTWKTMFPVLGLTFPIWVGGYRIADEVSSMGIDPIPDVINHRYQYKETLFERCWYAFHDNLKILTDIEYATEMRIKHITRLQQNRDKFLEGTVYQHCVDTVHSWDIPDEVKDIYINLFLVKFNKDLQWQ